MATALVTHPDCLGHVTPEGHPERVARLEHVLHALEGLDLVRVEAPLPLELEAVLAGLRDRAAGLPGRIVADDGRQS